MNGLRSSLLCLSLGLAIPLGSAAQPPAAPEPKASPIEKLGDNLFRLGSIRVDTSKRELSVSGQVNPVTVLEFVANTTNGMKAYESAITLDTNAITFNAALLLMGLDKSHSRIPLYRTDPNGVAGDPVEIWIDTTGPSPQHFRAERLIYDRATKEAASDGSWVFTGSSFLNDGRYRAEADGVLIGFVHDVSTILELTRAVGLGRYGAVILNPTLGLTPGMPITLTVKAVGAVPKPH
jgi:hypothetical protein